MRSIACEAEGLCFHSQPGTKVMMPPDVKDEELPKLFPTGMDKVSMLFGISYVRTTTGY
jgi:peroxidase